VVKGAVVGSVATSREVNRCLIPVGLADRPPYSRCDRQLVRAITEGHERPWKGSRSIGARHLHQTAGAEDRG
jgi:hypothetical protein